MQTRLLGVLSLICLIITILWLVFLVADRAAAGPLDTFDQVLAHVNKPDALFYLTYANAALITVSAVMLFAALYIHYKPIAPEWSAIGVMFVPIYGALNLIAYLSQITVVPRLLQLQALPEYQAFSRFLLRQVIQQWPDSTISIINNLAYAVLGVPSIIFGILMFKSARALRPGGVLLALNGLACIAGFIGIAAQNAWLSQGSLMGGVLFLLALAPMSLIFLQQSKTPGEETG
ncbi:MAG: hypothetical protein CVU39_22545 [Chloroflexi bacterium HGW-Chloroflexi-10]|nr:MAG: hypothetical protein CVU39_22545 [Chloroflexi bacterium HGW-Chloroflexi-10]